MNNSRKWRHFGYLGRIKRSQNFLRSMIVRRDTLTPDAVDQITYAIQHLDYALENAKEFMLNDAGKKEKFND